MKILVIFNDGKIEEMDITKACEEYRISEKQIQHAIRTGYPLKTMCFDEIIER